MDTNAVVRVWRYIATSANGNPAVEFIQGTDDTNATNFWWDIFMSGTYAVQGEALNFRRRSAAEAGSPLILMSLLTAGQIAFKVAQADQSKVVQTPTTGFSITIGNATTTTLLTPAGTLASGTITMPAAPVDGQIVRVLSSHTVTALTVSPNTSQSVSGAPTMITSTTPFSMIYDLASTTWYRMA